MNAMDELLVKWADGNLTSDERSELEQHYSKEDLDEFLKMTNDLALTTTDVDLAWNNTERNLQRAPKSRTMKWIWIVLGVMLVCSIIALYLWAQVPQKVIKNTGNEPMLIAMMDNTDIKLAPGSSISFHEDDYADRRKVWLDGRAFFDVKQKGDYHVIIDDAIVSVLGTQFDVWEIGEEKLQVQCYEGKVGVTTSNGNEAQLIAGQKLDSNYESNSILGDLAESAPSWLSNSIIFNNITLSTVYKEVEMYYKVAFVGKKSNQKFNGELPTDDLEKVIKILNAVTSDKYEIKDNQVVVSAAE